MTTIQTTHVLNVIEYAQERGITLACITTHEASVQGWKLGPDDIQPTCFIATLVDEATQRKAIEMVFPGVVFINVPDFQAVCEARTSELREFPVSSPPLHEHFLIVSRDGVATTSLAELVAPLPVFDEPLHTDEHPFCSDEPCPCHTNDDLFQEYIEMPYQDGLITAYEAVRLFYGCHL